MTDDGTLDELKKAGDITDKPLDKLTEDKQPAEGENKEPIVPDPEPQPEVPRDDPDIEEVEQPPSESVTTADVHEKRDAARPPKTTETGGAITTEHIHRLREEAKRKG
jgi:hypothetical protein